MGFNGSYKVLSPLSPWDASGQKFPPESNNNSNNTGGNDRSKQQKVLEFVKKWLLCGGWMLGSSEYAPVISPGKSQSSTPGAGADRYVKPPGWKQFMRRVRAKSKKVQNACCEGLCFHPQQQPLNYCSTDSYERNFDKGREYWEDHALFSSRSASSAFAAAGVNYSGALHPANSGTPMLWENKPMDHFFVSSHQVPIAVAAG